MTSKKLSPERLAEIRNGLLNVSDGPWAWETHGDDGSFSIGIVDPPQTGQIVERFDEETETFASLPIVVEHIAENGADATFADASFIADARQAVPELLGHIEALDAELAEAQKEYEKERTHVEAILACIEGPGGWKQKAEAAEARVRELKRRAVAICHQADNDSAEPTWIAEEIEKL